ncbi:MAG: cupredoxin domain-containing protein [Patescibacteria group bacterium]
MSKKAFASLALILLAGAGCSSTATVTPEVPITIEDSILDTEPVIEIITDHEDPTTPPNSDNADDAEGAVKEFTITGGNFAFTPDVMTVKKGDTVRITFKNDDGFHDLVIDEFAVATKQIQAGASEVVEFVADKAGTFEYYCSVGKHREMGMKGVLTVTE